MFVRDGSGWLRLGLWFGMGYVVMRRNEIPLFELNVIFPMRCGTIELPIICVNFATCGQPKAICILLACAALLLACAVIGCEEDTEVVLSDDFIVAVSELGSGPDTAADEDRGESYGTLVLDDAKETSANAWIGSCAAEITISEAAFC